MYFNLHNCNFIFRVKELVPDGKNIEVNNNNR